MPIEINRRRALLSAGAGFGALPMADLLHRNLAAGATHFAPRAKRVIFLFMNGGPSHIDTFDPKPALKEHEGENPDGMNKRGAGLMPSPFKFSRHGESGMEMSELFPQLAKHADDLCLVRSMHTDTPNHEPGLLMMHSGNQQPIRPCLGSWVSYGLGSENENLPAFVSLCGGLPVVGPQLWSSAFLPANHQAMSVDTSDMSLKSLVAHLEHPALTREEQRGQLDLIAKLNRLHAAERAEDQALNAHIRSMELAFNMQQEASVAFDVAREPAHVRAQYGETNFGQSCLLGRRLLEHGVRYVQVYYVNKNKQPWDTHKDNNNRHRTLCEDSDRATAALLDDLKSRGMLEDTLVIWGGEFGRTPYAQKRQEQQIGRETWSRPPCDSLFDAVGRWWSTRRAHIRRQ